MEEEEEEDDDDNDDEDWDPTDLGEKEEEEEEEEEEEAEPAAQAEEISKEDYQRVKNTILEGKATEAVGLAPELRPAAEPAAQAGWLEDLLGEGTAVAAAEAARPRAEARPQEEAPEADLVS